MNESSIELQGRHFLVVYEKASGKLKIKSVGLDREDNELFTLMSAESNHKSNSMKGASLNDIALRCKGIVIDKSQGHICIYNDPFCTIPVYFFESNDRVLVSSSPEQLITYADTQLDAVGFWETILFGTGIWTRTPFQGLFQLPSACKLFLGQTVDISRYWGFEDGSVGDDSIDEREWVAGLDAKLREKFEIYRDKQVLMGMSGGMDSRIAALYLADVCAPENIHLFTYAASSASYEFCHGKQVSSVLGLSQPELFLLKDLHYKEALEYLPMMSAGQIGNVHGHIAEYLKHHKQSLDRNTIHFSTYYSDAIFGWECDGVAGNMGVEESYLYQKALTHPWVPEDIRKQMLDDIRCSLVDAQNASGFSTVDEFRYVSERNAKFHMPLAFIQSQFMQTVTPFADFDLLNYILSAPLALRKRKRVIDELIKFNNTELASVENCSSREYFYGNHNLMPKRGLSGKLAFIRFRALNALSACASFVTQGRFVFENPFQAEELGALYNRSYVTLFNESVHVKSISELLEKSNIDLSEFCEKRVIETHLAEKFQLINLARMIS